jgi:hypothetical protein
MAFAALNPTAAIVGLIDYTTLEGQKLYGYATKKLNDELFNCNADGLYQFLQSLGNRASKYGWHNDAEGIMKIPKDDVDPNEEVYYLVDEYRQITIKQIRELDETYIDTADRKAQDSYMLYQCLMGSIS